MGSKVGRALAGGFVRRMIVNYQVGQGVQPETSEVQIAPAMSGIGGGALGISKAKKEMASIAQAVHGALAANDQLAQIDSQFLPPAPGAPPQG